MKIIVVDDEPLVKQYIVQCVRDAGGENEITAAVTSGAKVLQEMKANPVDVVFADITMPKMDGIELLQELRRQYPSTAVIMLTCHDDFEYARAAMQNGAKDYILKPRSVRIRFVRFWISCRAAVSSVSRRVRYSRLDAAAFCAVWWSRART